MKRKKNIIVGIFVIFSLFAIVQMLCIYINKGNLSLTITNFTGNTDYTETDSIFIEIYIDGTKIIAEKCLDVWHSYTFYSMWVKPKNHVVVIKINGDVSQEIKFNAILFTNIFISYYGDSVYNDDGIRFNVRVSKWPIHFLS